MSDQNEQFKIDLTSAPTPPKAEPPRLEHKDDYDRLADQFNSTEIRIMLGDKALSPTTQVISVPEPPPKKPGHGRKADGTIDRRTLSPRQQLLADEPPDHIRHNPYA